MVVLALWHSAHRHALRRRTRGGTNTHDVVRDQGRALSQPATSTLTVHPQAQAPASRPRLDSIDVLRGLVMVIMALDHVRDYFHNQSQLFAPENLTRTDAALFFTRWITHFCAPAFIFLAGTAAYLYARRGRSTVEVSHFLWTRGLWLVLLELTVVASFGWNFGVNPNAQGLAVIWALGWSMVALAAVIHVPWRVLLAASVAMIVLHNTLDGVRPEQFGSLHWLWRLLHVRSVLLPSSDLGLGGHISADSVDWRHGRRLLRRATAGPRCRRAASHARARRVRRDRGIRAAAMVEPVRRSQPMVGPGDACSDRGIVPQLLEVSAVAALPADDARPDHARSGVAGRCSRGSMEPVRRVRARAAVLLPASPSHASWRGAALRGGPLRTDGFPVADAGSLRGPRPDFPPDYGYDLWIVYLVWIGIVLAYPLCRCTRASNSETVPRS